MSAHCLPFLSVHGIRLACPAAEHRRIRETPSLWAKQEFKGREPLLPGEWLETRIWRVTRNWSVVRDILWATSQEEK